jgi:16S rRNA (uracil1498-N3)-methyltransferase
VIDELRLAAAHVIVEPDALTGDHVALEPADAHHLGRVLRLRPGEIVTATDGAGRWRRCRWPAGNQRGRREGADLTADGPICKAFRPHPAVTIGFAPVKGDRPEWTVQKLTELGVDRIVVLRTARSVVRLDEGKVARLQIVAREAVMQSRQCHVPLIEGPMSVADLPEAALAHPGGEEMTLATPSILIGPEGGWDDAELAAARSLVGLGPSILRAETAAVAASVQLCALRAKKVPTERGRIT